MSNAKSMDVKKLTQLSILVAIEAIFCFVPILGSIPIGPMVATTAHIPVIIAAVLLGPGVGGFMGFIFGLFSFIVNSFVTPTVTSFVFTPVIQIGDIPGNFWSIFICFVPRILLGISAGLIYKAMSKFDKSDSWSYIVSSVGASLIHTFLVLFSIYIFFKEPYSLAIGKASTLLLGLIGGSILTNGVPEAILAAVVTIAVARPLKKALNKSLR